MSVGILRSMRPHQWVKNVFVLVPIAFAQRLTERSALLTTLAATAIFCVLSGTVYVLNDLVDVDADRQHPKKRLRPIASGQVTELQARTFISLSIVGCILAGWFLSRGFLAAALSYFVGNLAYSFSLKKIPYVDVGWIATGFMLRLLAGGLAPQPEIPLSWYLLSTTFFLALYLGFGKRTHELVNTGGAARGVLVRYSRRVLRVLLWGSGVATVLVYGAYTQSAHCIAIFGAKPFWLTVVPAAAAMARFAQLVASRDHESPTDAMLKDKWFIALGATTAVLMLGFLYA